MLRGGQALALLWAFLMVACALSLSASANQPTPVCVAQQVVVESDSRLEVVLGPFAPPMPFKELGVILVPAPGTAGEAGGAKHWECSGGAVFNYSPDLRLTVQHDPGEPEMQAGDILLIEDLGSNGLPRGTWLLFLIHEPTDSPCLSLTWVLGNVHVGQDLTFTKTGIADPMSEFGFKNETDSSWTLVALVIGEGLVLGLMLLLISRIE